MSTDRKRKVKPDIQLGAVIALILAVVVVLVFLLPGQSSQKKAEVITDKEVTIMIDPGHGGFDPGKSAPQGVKEADINLAVAKDVRDQLREMAPNAHVLLTRDTDAVTWGTTEQDDLNARTEMQETWKADYFVSIHSNSYDDASVSGYNMFIKPNDTASKQLADNIISSFEDISWSKNNGIITVDTSPIQIISWSKIPAVLIEMGYMTNSSDLEGLTSPESQQTIAAAIAKGIAQTVASVQTAPAQSSSSSDTSDASKSNE